MTRRLLALLLCGLLLPLPAFALNMGGGQGGGAGDILVTGTPAAGQVAIWVDPTHIQGASSVGLNVVAPATPGTLAATAGANNVTLVTLKRATDTTPTGNFVDYQNAAGTSQWRVDIAGILQVGNVPAGRITGGVTGAQMADNTVTVTKLADMATASVLGRTTTGTGDPEVVPLTTLWAMPKLLENTELKRRVLSQADVSPITIDADSWDIIKIAELSQATTFNPPTTATTHPVGRLLLFEIFTTVQRALTFSTATNGFIADANLALPTISNAGGLVKYLFEWNGSKWAFVSSSQTTTRGVLDDCYRSNGPNAEPGFRVCPAGGIAGTTGTIHLPVDAVKFPTSDAAVVDGSETNVRLLFDNAVRKCAYWGSFRMNADYNAANAPTFKLQYSMTSITSGNIGIDVQVMAVTPTDAADVNTESYDTINTCTSVPVPGTPGHMKEISCVLTTRDSLAAGDLTKVRLCRNVATSGNAAGVMEALTGALEYVR